MPDPKKTALVISAHAADFVWRCGGAIALHAAKGYEVTVVCLSFGERGESAKLWKEPGMTLERVKAARRAESEKAAAALGVHDLIELRPRRLPAAPDAGRQVPPRRRDPRGAAGLHAQPLGLRPLQHRPHVRDAGGARDPDDRPGLGPQAGREGARRAAALSLRAAPDRADGLEARHLPRHHPGLGEEARRDRVHGGAGAPLGVLHPRRAEPRQPLHAQLRRPVAAGARRSTPRASSRSSRAPSTSSEETTDDRTLPRPRPPRPRRDADRPLRREPRLLHPRLRPEALRPRRRQRLPARLGRLRVPLAEADPRRHHRRRPRRLPRRLARGARRAASRRSRPRATRSTAGSRATSATAAPSASRTRSATSSRSTTTPCCYEPQAGGRARRAEEHSPSRSRRAPRRGGSTTSTCSPRTSTAFRRFMETCLGSRVTELIQLDNGRLGGCWFTVNNKTYDLACTEEHGARPRAAAPRHLRHRPARGHPARRRHLPAERRPHRDRPAQARDPGHLLPLRLGAGRQPRRARQRRRAADPRARLGAGGLDRGRPEEGPGLGAEDHRELPHPRHPAGDGGE